MWPLLLKTACGCFDEIGVAIPFLAGSGCGVVLAMVLVARRATGSPPSVCDYSCACDRRFGGRSCSRDCRL
jgi:CO dehydrogenase/acetyl-CoA synthase beta subunit